MYNNVTYNSITCNYIYIYMRVHTKQVGRKYMYGQMGMKTEHRVGEPWTQPTIGQYQEHRIKEHWVKKKNTMLVLKFYYSPIVGQIGHVFRCALFEISVFHFHSHPHMY